MPSHLPSVPTFRKELSYPPVLHFLNKIYIDTPREGVCLDTSYIMENTVLMSSNPGFKNLPLSLFN
jgi:hypothetical protein